MRSVCNYSGWKSARIQAICSAPREKKHNDQGCDILFFFLIQILAKTWYHFRLKSTQKFCTIHVGSLGLILVLNLGYCHL